MEQKAASVRICGSHRETTTTQPKGPQQPGGFRSRTCMSHVPQCWFYVHSFLCAFVSYVHCICPSRNVQSQPACLRDIRHKQPLLATCPLHAQSTSLAQARQTNKLHASSSCMSLYCSAFVHGLLLLCPCTACSRITHQALTVKLSSSQAAIR